MSNKPPFKRVADQANKRARSFVTSSLEETPFDDLHIAGVDDSSVLLVDPELRIVVVPSIVPPRMVWELRYDIVRVSYSEVVSFRRSLLLDEV